MTDLTFRPACPDEIDAASALALRVFAADAAADHAPEGVAEYERLAGADAMRARAARIWVAEDAGPPAPTLVGMMEVRGAAHVMLLFVDRGHQRRGVARGLLAAAFGDAAGWPALTVNSTPSAEEAYRRLGFRATGPQREQNGIRYVPMASEAKGASPEGAPPEGASPGGECA